MSSFKMIVQLLSLLLFLTLLVSSVTSGRFLYDFDPVPSSATTPLDTDSVGFSKAVIEVVENPAVSGSLLASLSLGNGVLLTSNENEVPLIHQITNIQHNHS
ncbi:hypothetical protein ISN45_Aa05g014260 [Arabidopsis thaliana x Arabidopsis arenosa]|uniref:Transmembrane protein n=1 Tax=Arabidopsis thaliana x Arabidopsis arenosa TaxID=1240361 RepID=A0A8T1ZN61_9BRAS|nr:hypothetical protein ISN45_Aa05g014260 [Arabidopsis thaliana x Arabidopsis arenosa]